MGNCHKDVILAYVIIFNFIKKKIIVYDPGVKLTVNILVKIKSVMGLQYSHLWYALLVC